MYDVSLCMSALGWFARVVYIWCILNRWMDGCFHYMYSLCIYLILSHSRSHTLFQAFCSIIIVWCADCQRKIGAQIYIQFVRFGPTFLVCKYRIFSHSEQFHSLNNRIAAFFGFCFCESNSTEENRRRGKNVRNWWFFSKL